MYLVKLFVLQKSQLIKMACKDWSAGVYWEPKSPEWPSVSQQSGSRSAMSPDRSDYGPLSPYSDGHQSGFSPEYRGFSNKRARWDWSPESGISTGEGSTPSPYWTEYQWSPSSSGPTTPFSANEGKFFIVWVDISSMPQTNVLLPSQVLFLEY